MKRDWFFLVILSLIIFFIEVIIAYKFLTTEVPGANDFFSRWYGARALLLEGRDPYSLEVTEEIQPIIKIDPSEVGRGGFNYPLHVIFLFFPLVYFPYAWTQAIWWVTLQWLSICIVFILLSRFRWKPKVIETFLLIILTLSFYPICRSIFLGQFTIWVLLFLSLSLLSIKENKDFRAGLIFSVTSIKPQMVLFIAPWILFWIIGQKRWNFIIGLLTGGAILLFSSWILMPFWPLSFINDLSRYQRFAGGQNPVLLLLDYVFPNCPESLSQVIIFILLFLLIRIWWKNWNNSNENVFNRTLNWTIVIGSLTTFQTGTTNQVLLIILLFSWLNCVKLKPIKYLYIGGFFVLGFLNWALFLKTIEGNKEDEVMFLPMLLICLFILVIQAINRKYREVQAI
jgi:hypothetical protein